MYIYELRCSLCTHSNDCFFKEYFQRELYSRKMSTKKLGQTIAAVTRGLLRPAGKYNQDNGRTRQGIGQNETGRQEGVAACFSTTVGLLKLKCRQYPAIHSNYSCSNCTISNEIFKSF